MTPEEKAKAYDKVLEKAIAAYKDEDRHLKATLERLFPQLKESEDERIREFLIHEVTETSDEIMSYRNMNKKDVLAWLEKQGEQKSAEWSEEDEAKLKSACALIRNTSLKGNDEIIESTINWLKSLKPQPKQEWNEEDEKMIRGLIVICDEWTTSHSFYPIENCEMEKLKKWLKSLRPQKQWKPSEEQMEVLVWCKPLFADPKSKDILQSLINDLKKLTE